ncbi:MAG: acetyl-CoA hydrolase/transferase family protein [Chloroflexi bacterium]|nr:acetyl-CoA hydrolase/transferase family protein [Chloroflexota bacterium]
MDWREEYKRKSVTAEEALKAVNSGDFVAFTTGREPQSLGYALAARATEMKGVRIHIQTPGLDFGWYERDPIWEEAFQIKVGYVFPKGVVREWIDERRGDYMPGTLIPFEEREDLREPDALLAEVSPPDEHGYCSFGASVWNKKEQIRAAKTVIAEVNHNLIRTYGENFVHVSEIDYFVEFQRTAGWGIRPPAPPPEAKAVADLVATLVQDGDCVQVGAGTLAESLPSAGVFDNKVDLGLHTEMTARGLVKLVREGVINGRRKQINPGKAVATAVGGSREDMAYINMNPLFEVYSAAYVVNPKVICLNDNVCSINNGLMVDLTGQITAEAIGPRMISGSGGQPAFAWGANMSRGGRFILVLPATAAGGTASRIVPLLPRGTVMTVPRYLADIVVTEWGIAQLKGKTVRERAEALIEVAHPDFRGELRKEAKRVLEM